MKLASMDNVARAISTISNKAQLSMTNISTHTYTPHHPNIYTYIDEQQQTRQQSKRTLPIDVSSVWKKNYTPTSDNHKIYYTI